MRVNLAAAFVSALLLFSGGPAMAYDEPAFEVLAHYDDFEIRRYAPYVVAETLVEGEFGKARNVAFRRLFAYISGENTAREKIAMTTPVNQRAAEPRGEKIAMTVPVFSNETSSAEGSNGHVMEFVMPPGATLQSLPVPNDPTVRLREVSERTVAAWRYSGNSNQPRYLEHVEKMEQALENEGIAVVGAPALAVYNGPFTLGPWRRNEVVVDVRPPKDVPAG